MIDVRILFGLNSFRINGYNSPKFTHAFILRRFRLGFCPGIFLQICYRVMAFDLWQNFISAQYLQNNWIELYIFLYALILTIYVSKLFFFQVEF